MFWSFIFVLPWVSPVHWTRD